MNPAIEEHTITNRYFGSLTLGHVALVIIFILAAVLRFGDLGIIPLSPEEAAQANGVWNFWNRTEMDAPVGSPIYFTLTAIISQIVGFSDAAMRVIPALFGMALVAAPWFIRHRLGLLGSLIASLLLALSPSLVLVSRIASGQAAALFAGMLILVAWFNLIDYGEDRWLYALAVGFGIGVISSEIFFSIALCLLLAWLIQSRFGQPIQAATSETHPSLRRYNRRSLIWSGVLFLIVVILGSTAFLFNPIGLGSAISLLTNWLEMFGLSGDALSLMSPVLALGRYEPIILLLGGAAVVWATWKGSPFPMLLAYWFILTFILTFLQRGTVLNIVLLTLPGTLLIGALFTDTFRKPVTGLQLLLTAVIVALGTVVFINISRFARLLTIPNSTASRYNIFLAVTLAALIAIAILLAWSWDKSAAKQSVLISAVLMLIVLTWGTAWWMSRDAANDTRERWVNEAADDGIFLLSNAVKDVSWQLTNSDSDLEIASTVQSPILEWYLRDFDRVDFVASIPQNLESQALLTEENAEPALKDSYVGSTFGYLRSDTSHILDFGQTLRWWLFHESPIPINEGSLVFWVRADLVGETP